jgi:hypothetical protein
MREQIERKSTSTSSTYIGVNQTRANQGQTR